MVSTYFLAVGAYIIVGIPSENFKVVLDHLKGVF